MSAASALTTVRSGWGGERVQDVTEHPAFVGSVQGVSGFFDWQHLHARDCIFADPVSKQPTGISHLVPRSADDLLRRHTGLERLARYSMGMLGRTPDYVNLTFAGFAGQPSVWSANGNAQGAENLVAFQRHVAEKDLALTHTIIHPTVDGRLPPYDGVNGEAALRKVSETGEGIVVRGARILATLGPFADELAVYPGQPIPKDRDDVALVFSIPLSSPGLKIICRDHYGLDVDPFDKPFSSRFDEQDAFVVFDDVEVPRRPHFPGRRPRDLQRRDGPGMGGQHHAADLHTSDGKAGVCLRTLLPHGGRDRPKPPAGRNADAWRDLELR